MATATIERPQTQTVQRKWADYRSETKPTWCPGCGDFGVLASIYRALARLNLDPKDVVIVSGIGCSGRLPEFVSTYGLHVVHGRALPTATGVKLANPDLTVLAVGGDGDGFAIGGGHVPHAARRNVDITYIVMDNEVYGLTKGQPSPTTPRGDLALKSSNSMAKMAPYGEILETPLNILAMLLIYGASFVARAFSGQPKQLEDIVVKATQHKGFSFVQAMSPCPTWFNTYDPWKDGSAPLPDWDSSDRVRAIDLALTEDKFHLGVFYEDHRPSYDELYGAVIEKAQGERAATIESLLSRFG